MSLTFPDSAAGSPPAPIRPKALRSVPPAVTAVRFWGRSLLVLVVTVWAGSLVFGFERAIVILTLVGFGAAVAGLFRPGLGLLGIGMLCTLDTLTSLFLQAGRLWRWNTFNYWLLIVMSLSLPALWRLRGLPVRLIQVLIAVLMLGLLYTNQLSDGIQQIFNLVVWFGLIVYFQRGAGSAEAWYWLGLVSGALAAAGGLVYYLQRSSLREVNPNAMAMFPLAGLFAVCLAYSFTVGRTWRQMLLAGVSAINCVWIFLTGSRGTTLVAVACVVFLFTQTAGKKRGVFLVGAALLAVAVGSQFRDRGEYARERLDLMFDSHQSMRARTSGRADLVIGAWYIFLDHPLLGVGTGGFAQAWSRLDRGKGLSKFRRGEVFAAHSAWMKVLAENGVPGFVAMVAFVASFGWVGWWLRRQGVLPVALLATFSMALVFISHENSEKAAWFLAAGAMTRILRARAEQRRTLAQDARVTTALVRARSVRGG